MKKNREILSFDQNIQASSILESITDGFFAVDAHWNYMYINAHAEKLLGYKKEELLGKNMWKVFPHMVHTEVYTQYQNIRKTKKSAETEYYAKGHDLWFHIHAYPLQNGLAVYFQDITQRKKEEENFRQYKERFDHAQSAGHIGIFDWNLETNEMWWSDEEKRLFGMQPTDTIEKYGDWKNTRLSLDAPIVSEKLKECIKNKKNYEGEFRIIRTDGSIRWLKGKGTFHYDENKKPVRMIGVNYDITDRKQIEGALKYKAEASKILSSSLDYKTTFKSISQLAVPHIADWYAVDMLDENGNLELVAIAHIDPKKVKWARELRKVNPTDMNAPTGLPQVIRTGVSGFFPDVTDEMLVKSAKTEEELALARKLELSSIMIVPITVEGKTIGGITFVYAESKRHYTHIDLQMAEQLASRAGMAIENARLYSEVRRERERLHTLVANVPGLVWESWGKPDAKSQRIDFVSKHVEEMLGYTVNEWLNTPNFWLTIVHPEDKERAAEEAAAIFSSGKIGTSRFRWVKKNGGTIWVEAQSYVIKDKKGNPVGMRGVTMDISERMEMERRKDEFISMASHELKTPITSVKVFIQVLHKMSKEKGEKQMQKYLGRMDQQMNKFTTLVSDLLDVSKIQAGKLDLRMEPFSLQKLIRETVENMQAMTENHKIVVRGIVKKKVVADRERISQVLINLLSNAIKYSPESKKIILSIAPNSHNIILSVKDYGVGIPKEYHVKIFERFYRVYDNTDKTYPGLGMGLYISSQILQKHSGKMWVKSEKGKGATFYVALPYENKSN